jgi:hypothetical protein
LIGRSSLAGLSLQNTGALAYWATRCTGRRAAPIRWRVVMAEQMLEAVVARLDRAIQYCKGLRCAFQTKMAPQVDRGAISSSWKFGLPIPKFWSQNFTVTPV